VYPAHEYTQKNLEFTLDKVDPDNKEVQDRLQEVKKLRSNNTPSLPVKMDIETRTNPFLRSDNASIKKHLGLEDSDKVEVLSKIRKLKDNY
jgi:hydroxyacylglutathione hydrolase